MKRIIAALSAAALASLAFAQPVQIGVLAPLTGAAAGTGQAQQAGFELALEEINAAGGVLGEPLELIIEDTQANVAVGLAAFEKLMTEDNVGIVAGGFSSGVTLGLVESFRTFQPLVTWIGGATSGIGLEGFDGIEDLLGAEPWFFHIHPWDYHNTEAATAFVVSTGAETAALLTEDGAFGGPGGAATQVLLEEAGIEVPIRETFTSTLTGGSGDFRAAITRARSSDADMLYWIGYDGDAVPMSSQIRELGYTPDFIFGAPPGWPSDFGASPEAQCVTGLIGYSPNLPNPEAIAFRDAYVAMHNTEPDNYMAALAYANLWALADAINTAGTDEQTAVAAALEAGTFRSPMGDWGFSQSVISPRQGFGAEMWLVFQYQNGEREIVYPAELATAPLMNCF